VAAGGGTIAAMLAVLASLSVCASRVAVSIATQLAVPPAEARAAWLEYAWSQGGGLPGTALIVDKEDRSRTLLPVFLKEQLVTSADEEDIVECYTVTDAGPALQDVVAGSHSARVTFRPSAEGTDMIWDVGFDVSARRDFWAAFTRTTVGEVSANLAASLQREGVFTLTARLAGTPENAADTWMQCLYDGDLGVPMPPPIVLSEGDGMRVGYTRLIVPPGLRERVTRVERSEGSALIEYTVLNPSWLTCYPVHTHRGEVKFEASEDGVTTMTWRVCVRPQRFGRWAVELLTTLIVPAFARNLAARLGDDGGGGSDVRWEWR